VSWVPVVKHQLKVNLITATFELATLLIAYNSVLFLKFSTEKKAPGSSKTPYEVEDTELFPTYTFAESCTFCTLNIIFDGAVSPSTVSIVDEVLLNVIN